MAYSLWLKFRLYRCENKWKRPTWASLQTVLNIELDKNKYFVVYLIFEQFYNNNKISVQQNKI